MEPTVEHVTRLPRGAAPVASGAAEVAVLMVGEGVLALAEVEIRQGM